MAQFAIDDMLAARTLWHAGCRAAVAADGEPTGFDALDALLPQGGWPRKALTELLLPADGVGELSLLLPTLARFTRAGATVVVVAPPYLPYAPAWQVAGVDLAQLQVVEAAPRDALWAFEQCLRSGACAAVLGWPATADAQALRRLQVAADSGAALGFALRERRHAANPSPAALRLEAVRDAACGDVAWRVRKCRGGPVPSQGVRLASDAMRAAQQAIMDVEGRTGAAMPETGVRAKKHMRRDADTSRIPVPPATNDTTLARLPKADMQRRRRLSDAPSQPSLSLVPAPVHREPGSPLPR